MDMEKNSERGDLPQFGEENMKSEPQKKHLPMGSLTVLRLCYFPICRCRNKRQSKKGAVALCATAPFAVLGL